jgi:hypothetical protein
VSASTSIPLGQGLPRVLRQEDDHVERLEEDVRHLGRIRHLPVAHLDHDVLEPVRDVRDLDEADHARGTLERVRVAKHLVDERAVARVALEHDDAFVEALEVLPGLFLELAYERAAVELDHGWAAVFPLLPVRLFDGAETPTRRS